MTQVFISYSRSDMEFVQRLAEDLQRAGLDVWWDLSGIQGSDVWERKIEESLKSSQYFIVVLTPISLESRWVRREYLSADNNKGIKIIPLKLKTFHELPLALRDIQPIDAIDRPYEDVLSDILKIVSKNKSYEVSTTARKLPIDHPYEDVLSDALKIVSKNKSYEVSVIARKLRVFLCYGFQDELMVHRIYEHLSEEEWIEPWLDKENLLPGQNRDLKLQEVLKSTDVVLLCLSQQSLEQESNFQREIELVVDLAKEKPERSIFVIPILLDDCEMPRILHSWQPVKFFGSEVAMGQAYERIYKSMRAKFDLASYKTVENPLHIFRSTQPEVFDDLADLTFGGFSFVKIPKGKFIMGSKASNNLSGDNEHPQRPYGIPYNYWINCFPVTNENFSEYAVSTRKIELLPNGWKESLNQPMVNVSWHEAMEYTKWLNKIFKKEIPNGLVFRLPTEAEWERASRGDLGAEWPWGNENLDDFLNSGRQELLVRLKRKSQLDKNKSANNFADYFANFSKPKPSEVGNDPEKSELDLIKMKLDELRRSMELTDVGTFSPVTDSPYDVADIMGAVWEWTQSLYMPYPYDMDDGRENLEVSGERVIRGSFISRSERFSVRSAKRGRASPDRKEPYLGFRIVVAPPVS